MDTEQDNKNWHLIRNDNGEWISDENAFFLSKVQLRLFLAKAKRLGMPLFIQHGPDGSLWCYKIQLEAMDIIPKETYSVINKK